MENPKVFPKVVKKWGKSLVIVLNKDDLKILKLKEGDVIVLQIISISRGKKGDELDGLQRH